MLFRDKIKSLIFQTACIMFKRSQITRIIIYFFFITSTLLLLNIFKSTVTFDIVQFPIINLWNILYKILKTATNCTTIETDSRIFRFIFTRLLYDHAVQSSMRYMKVVSSYSVELLHEFPTSHRNCRENSLRGKIK